MADRDLFTEQDLEDAVRRLSTMPFFPQDAAGDVMDELRKMCPHRTALQWVVREMTTRVHGNWPGLTELRGLLCTRYDAADHIDVACNLPGYRWEDAEARHYERHQQLTHAGGYLTDEARAELQLAAGEVAARIREKRQQRRLT